jgi:hypothetical protein
MWDPSIKTVKTVVCLPKDVTDGFWYFICGITPTSPISGWIWLTQAKAIITLTDVAFSLLPIAFMYRMNIPMRERLVLCLLMALGLFASSVVLIRTTTFRRYQRVGDKLWYMSDISIWNLLEGELAIFAACIPYLKSTMERALKKMGLLKENHTVHGATSVRISGHDYDVEMEAARRRMEKRGGEKDDADESVAELTPPSDAHSDGKSIDFHPDG